MPFNLLQFILQNLIYILNITVLNGLFKRINENKYPFNAEYLI